MSVGDLWRCPKCKREYLAVLKTSYVGCYAGHNEVAMVQVPQPEPQLKGKR